MNTLNDNINNTESNFVYFLAKMIFLSRHFTPFMITNQQINSICILH